MVISSLEDLVDAIADRLADRMAARDTAPIDQRDPRGLMGRRHIDAVRRRLSERAGGAYVKGRDYLLTPEAVREEFERLSRGGLVSRAPVEPAPRRKAGKPSKVSAKQAEQADRARIKRELESDMRRAREKA